MRRLWIVLGLVLLAVAACQRDVTAPTTPDPTPAPPAPFPRAVLAPVGPYTFTGCTVPPTSTCVFTGALENRGQGCGYQITGVTRLFDLQGLQLGAAYPWRLPQQQIVRPGERIVYSISFVPIGQALTVSDYTTTPNWVDTQCF